MRTADPFTTKIFRRMWIPAVVSSIGWALSDIADAVVVGQRMGTIGLAAIALILPVYMINCLFAHGLGIGGSIRYSKLLAEGKPREAVNSFNGTVQAALAFSLLTAVMGNVLIIPLLKLLGTVPSDGALFEATRNYLRILLSASPLFYLSNVFNYYLRNDDNGKLAGVGSVVGNLADIGLNILFVLILNMGTMGAALSTAIGQMIAILVYLPGIVGRPHILQLKWVRLSLRHTAGILRDGFACSVSYLFQLVFLLLCNNVLIRMGDETSVAVFDMIQNASYLILYLYEGTNRAMQPLVGTYHGEHRENGTRAARRMAFYYGSAAGLGVTCWIFLFPQSVCALFGIASGEALVLGSYGLRLYCIGSVFAGISLLTAGYFQACGRERDSLLIAALRGGVVLFPVTLLFSRLNGTTFWWLFPVTEAISLFIWSLALKKGRHPHFDCKRLWNGTVYSSKDDISALTAGAKALCEKWGADAKQGYFVTMTIEETCLAILENGFPGGGECLIELVLVAEENGTFTLHIRDNAVCFNPFELETEKVSDGGSFDMDAMGMMIIKSKAKTFFYRQYGGFNSLVVTI